MSLASRYIASAVSLLLSSVASRLSYNLLNLFRSIGSGYNVTLQGDVTHKASSAALNNLIYGTNCLGGHFAQLLHALIPAES